MNRSAPALIREVLRDWRSLLAGTLLFIVLPAALLLVFGDR